MFDINAKLLSFILQNSQIKWKDKEFHEEFEWFYCVMSQDLRDDLENTPSS